jgi:ribosomal protein S27AE
MPRRPRFTEPEARLAIAKSRSWNEALRRLGYSPRGGNPATVRKYVEKWGISTAHFDSTAASIEGLRRSWPKPIPLTQILVEGSTYNRNHLKTRLLRAGLKQPLCELCGQGEIWRGRRMALILDHVNGRSDDNRIENLRIVCPNCAATLDTHCGRKNKQPPRSCERCGETFVATHTRQRYCSRYCGTRWNRNGVPRLGGRKVPRPPYEQLNDEIERTSYLAVGRKYGVSDNAVRKWVRQYEHEQARAGT